MSVQKNLGYSLFGLVLAGLSPILFSFASSTAAAAEAASKAGDAHAGQALFTSTCAQCHVVVEGQTGFGPNLYHETRKPGKKTPAEIRTIIQNGKGKMPPLGQKFDAKQIDDIVAYVKTL